MCNYMASTNSAPPHECTIRVYLVYNCKDNNTVNNIHNITSVKLSNTCVTRFAKRGLIHTQFQDTLFITI